MSLFFGPQEKRGREYGNNESDASESKLTRGLDWPYAVADIVFVFLAHDGVTQPSVWNLWSSLDEQLIPHIHFCVHTPSRIHESSSFENRHGLKIEFGPTEWCNATLVYEHVKALRAAIVLHEKPNRPSMYFMVSGMDIPIKPPHKFFETYESIIAHYDQDGGSGFNSQWMALTLADAKTVVNEYLSTPEGRPTAEFTKDALRAVCLDTSSPKVVSRCPDEWMVTSLIKQKKLTDYHGPRLLCWEMIWSSESGISPLTWTSSDMLFPFWSARPPVDRGYCPGKTNGCEIPRLLHNAPEKEIMAYAFPYKRDSTGKVVGPEMRVLPFVGFKRALCFFRLSSVGFVMRKVSREIEFKPLSAFYVRLFSRPDDLVEWRLDDEIEADAKNENFAREEQFLSKHAKFTAPTQEGCAQSQQNPEEFAARLWKV